MRTRLLSCIAGAACAVAGVVAANAHHAFSAEFDSNRPIRLEGTVTEWEWINPHAWINLDVVNEAGETEKWRIEGGAPNALLRRGWSKDSLPPGTEIIVEGFLARDGAMRASGREITFADGRKLFVGATGIGAPQAGEE
ncbi:DUF6152 family protein [Candidatus Rariloculus sp.]|uniref:DUF6152 family protein n=1 Tax=Candidatus Rariloculus sp. TaxID=3101265 RepID=UPI003D12D697